MYNPYYLIGITLSPTNNIHRLMKIVEKKKTIQNWPLFEVDPLDKWASDSGKFIVIGDAAHAMVPYLSMGTR
jgi:salicylate hydroxylase